MTNTVPIHKEIEADGRVFDVTVHVGYEQGDSIGGFSNGGFYVHDWESQPGAPAMSDALVLIDKQVNELNLERELANAAWEAKQARAGI